MSSEAPSSSGQEGRKLTEIFDDVWRTWEYTDNTNDPSNSDVYQGKVKVGCELAEFAISMVNELRLYSDNEELEEVASNELKYMLLPAILGYIQLKLTGDERIATLKKASIYYRDFLRMCKNYKLTEIETEEISTEEEASKISPVQPAANSRPSAQELISMNARRQQKIERFKEQKQNEKELKEMKPLVEREHVDDEVKRKYYTTLLKRWVNTSIEELDSIQDELSMLEQMAKMRASGVPPPKPPQKSNTAFRPFILTKSDIQKKVFGAGYPSLPTYTVEEFYEQQEALGNLPQPGSNPGGDPGDEAAAREADAAKAEAAEEREDQEALDKARSWDEWTDDHRKGWGNTHNKG